MRVIRNQIEKDRLNTYRRSYYKAHPEKQAEYTKRYRLKIKALKESESE